MEYVITKEMKALEEALNNLGLDYHFNSYGAYCVDNKTHYGTEIELGDDEATLLFTPSGKLVFSWLDCPTEEKNPKDLQKKKGKKIDKKG